MKCPTYLLGLGGSFFQVSFAPFRAGQDSSERPWSRAELHLSATRSTLLALFCTLYLRLSSELPPDHEPAKSLHAHSRYLSYLNKRIPYTSQKYTFK